MKKIILCLLFIFSSNYIPAQSLDWAFALDTAFAIGSSEGLCIATDSSGNTYVGGTFRGGVDFDPGFGIDTAVSLVNKQSAFIAKYDAGGNFVWCNKFLGNGTGFVTHSIPFMRVNEKQELYFIVQTGTWSAFGATLYKADTDSGTITNVHSFWGNGWHEGANMNDFFIDDSLNFYLIMSVLGTVNLGPVYFASGSYSSHDLLVVKLDSVGNYIWHKSFECYNDDVGIDIAADDFGNVYFTGTFNDEIDVDPGPDTVLLVSSNPTFDHPYIVKLNSNGNYVNSKLGGSPTYFSKIDVTSNNEVIGTEGNKIFRLDSSLTHLWTKYFINASSQNFRLDKFDNIFTFGSFNSGNDFDPGVGTYSLPTSATSANAFVTKLDHQGSFMSALGFQTTINAFDPTDPYLVLTGKLNDTADFDPYASVYNLHAINNAYVSKFIKCSITGPTLFLNGCDSMVINGQAFFSSGSYTQTIRSAGGCDSTIILNLTINHSNSSNYSVAACDSLLYHGLYYSLSGLYDVTLINAEGCDSIVHLSLSINHSYNVPKMVLTCPSYFFAGNILTSSGIYYDSLQSVTGCDSIIVLNLTLVSGFANTITVTACKKYTSPAGNILTTSGIYTDSLLSVNGCDSVITVNLTVLHPANNVYQFSNTIYCSIPNLQYQWYVCNGSSLIAIAGATSQGYTTNVSGSYALIVIQNGCKDTSACFTITNVGINETETSDILLIYPNPVTDVLHITSDNNLVYADIVIQDIVGKIIGNYNYTKGELMIDTRNLLPGVYFAVFRNGERTIVKKFFKAS